MRLGTPLLGPYNVLNVAGAASLALAVGTGEEALVRAVRGMGQVPGRFERVATAGERGFEVIVDYAHTDVGLDAVLRVARGVAGRGRVVCVFGAAGDRDGEAAGGSRSGWATSCVPATTPVAKSRWRCAAG